MSARIEVDYDESDKRLIVRCPYYANDLIRDLPSHRWSKSRRAWLVPLIRRNVEALRSDKLRPYVDMTPAARAAIERLNTAVSKSRQREGFPAWYPFKTKPRKHQVTALNKGYGLDAYAMFMDMGTGKTKVAIDLNFAWRMAGRITAWLIVCKLTLRRNWVNEIAKHAPQQVTHSAFLPDSGQPHLFSRWMMEKHDFPVMIVGFESLSAGRMHELVRKFLMTHGNVGITADETTYIAGHKATRSKRMVEFGRMGGPRLALTGTPIPDGPMNLFMQFEYLDPNIIGIGDFYAFRNRYAVMGGYRDPKTGRPMQVVGYQNIEELTETVAPHTFQIMKSEAYDLPPKSYKTHYVRLTQKQRDLYKQIKRDESILFGRNPEVVLKNVLGVALRLHQVVGGWTVKSKEVTRMTREGERVVKEVFDPVPVVKDEENPKLLEVQSIVLDAGRRRQGIVWCVYTPEIEAVVRLLQGMGKRVAQLHGGIPELMRQPMVDGFERGEYDWLVGNASTGGMGYTLNAASIQIFYNNTFKLIDRLQAEDRSYRDGQTKPVLYIDLVAEKTMDETILAALADKKDLADYIRERISYASKLLDGGV